MKIIALLSAFDESPSWLSTAVAGCGRFCDALIYADGGYALLPGARPRSMPDQADAVIAAAEAADLEVIVHRPKDIYWNNEVEKRNKTLALAGAIASDHTWVVVVDADQHLMKCNAEVIRADLESTDRLVASYTVLDGRDQLADANVAELAKQDLLATEWTTRIHCCYRWHPSLEYGPLHWSVSRDVDGSRRWLWGPKDAGLLPALDLNAALVFYHRSEDRALVRRQAQEGYYRAREAHGVETWAMEGVAV